MADEISRATEAQSPAARTNPKTISDTSNVEFLETALSNPINVLRAKIKDFSELPEGMVVRRVLVIADVVHEDGRALDVTWSEGLDEPSYVVQDSLVSMLARVENVLVGGED